MTLTRHKTKEIAQISIDCRSVQGYLENKKMQVYLQALQQEGVSSFLVSGHYVVVSHNAQHASPQERTGSHYLHFIKADALCGAILHVSANGYLLEI